jgi:flagellar biosynthesis protein FlhF
VKLLSFLGQTPNDALNKAVKCCGEDAVVISTKKISSATKNSVEMYEIVVSVEEENKIISPKQAISKPVINNQVNNNAKSSSVLQRQEILDLKKSVSDIKNIEVSSKLEKEELLDLKKSVLDMQNTIFNMQNTLWNSNSKNTINDLAIPIELSDIYKLFEQNDMPKDITYKILKHTIEKLPANIKNKPKKVNNFFKLILRRMLSIKYEQPLKSGKTKIMIFVGPTGVGKTTTIAKTAARFLYKLRDTSKIGLISLDSFRVGAAEQLNTYAKIMQIPIQMVKEPNELSSAIKRLGEPQLILIDTPGSSQYDKKMIKLTKTYFDENPNLEIEKNLILPTNIKSSDLKEIYNEFSILDIDNIIFTKLDETKSFGNVINFAYEVKKPLTYFSIGQNVPDDFILSDDNFLIDCFFNQGIKRKES